MFGLQPRAVMLDLLRNYPELLNAIGVTGFVIYIASFRLVQSGRMCGNGIPYALANVIAASLVLLSLATAFNLASFLIQISFITIGILGILRKLRRTRDTAETAAVPRSARKTEKHFVF